MDQSLDNMTDSKQLDALSNTLKGLRDEAVKGRAASGIEAEWLEDEEYYEGIDSENRSARAIKPTSPDGRVMMEGGRKKKSTGSTVFVNITRPYVNAASAKLADMRFPTDNTNNAAMRSTPVPDLVQAENDFSPASDENGQPIHQAITDEQGQPQIDPATGQPVVKQATKADLAKAEQKKAVEACDRASNKINDWLIECGYSDEGRQVIEDAARLGTGVLKGPFPENVRKRAVVHQLEKIGVIIKDELTPKSKCISVWNCYPDPSCGESIHNGKYFFEKADINTRKLQELKRDPSYLGSAIDRVIEEGPKNHLTGETTRRRDEKPNDKESYEIWYYTGYLSKDDLEVGGYKFDQTEEPEGLISAQPEETGEIEGQELAGILDELDLPDGCGCEEEENKQYPATVVMVNNVIIKATMQPLDSGEFPYDFMVWQRRSGSCYGVGVSRQIRTSQDGVNAATRMLMNNAGVSAAPTLIVDRSKIVPLNGDSWMIGGRKVYGTVEGAEVTDIRQAFTWIVAPSMQQELTNIVQFWMMRAEQEVGLPAILQGQLSQNTPDTAKGQTIANNNGNTVLRRVLWNFEKAAKAHIGRYYEWLMMYGEDDSMKGDFTVEVRDISAIIERDNQSNMLMQMLGMSANPAFGLDPELVMLEMLKAQRFDADKLKLSDEKKQKMAQAQPQAVPAIEVAKIRAEAQIQVEQLQAKEEADHAIAQARMDLQRQQFDAQQNELDRQSAQIVATINERMQNATLTSEERQNLDKIKATLAQTSAKLSVQKDLSVAGHAIDIHKHRNPQVITPPTEPGGRAKPGEAWQK